MNSIPIIAPVHLTPLPFPIITFCRATVVEGRGTWGNRRGVLEASVHSLRPRQSPSFGSIRGGAGMGTVSRGRVCRLGGSEAGSVLDASGHNLQHLRYNLQPSFRRCPLFGS